MSTKQPIFSRGWCLLPTIAIHDREISSTEKLLLSLIISLSARDGFCRAGNKYFAKTFGLSTVSISNAISHLIEKEYLTSQMIYAKDSRRILQRRLFLVAEMTREIPNPLDEDAENEIETGGIKENFNRGIKENFNTGIKENFKDINKYINKKSKYISSKEAEKTVNKILN